MGRAPLARTPHPAGAGSGRVSMLGVNEAALRLKAHPKLVERLARGRQ